MKHNLVTLKIFKLKQTIKMSQKYVFLACTSYIHSAVNYYLSVVVQPIPLLI